jgi:hypothetical protein
MSADATGIDRLRWEDVSGVRRRSKISSVHGTTQSPPLIRRHANLRTHRLRLDRRLGLRIKHDEIGVEPHIDKAFAIEATQMRGR